MRFIDDDRDPSEQIPLDPLAEKIQWKFKFKLKFKFKFKLKLKFKFKFREKLCNER